MKRTPGTVLIKREYNRRVRRSRMYTVSHCELRLRKCVERGVYRTGIPVRHTLLVHGLAREARACLQYGRAPLSRRPQPALRGTPYDSGRPLLLVPAVRLRLLRGTSAPSSPLRRF